MNAAQLNGMRTMAQAMSDDRKAAQWIREQLESGPQSEQSLYCKMFYASNVLMACPDITYDNMLGILRVIATARNVGLNEFVWTLK